MMQSHRIEAQQQQSVDRAGGNGARWIIDFWFLVIVNG